MVGTRVRYWAGMIWSVSMLSSTTYTGLVSFFGISTQEFARIGHMASQSRSRHSVRTGKINLRFLAPHPPRKVPVRRADTGQRRVQPAKGVLRSTQTSGTGGVFGHHDTRVDQYVPDGICAQASLLQV